MSVRMDSGLFSFLAMIPEGEENEMKR